MRKTTCSKCGKYNDSLPQKYCRLCKNAYAREHRPKYSELTPLQRKKDKARTIANVYKKRGKITKLPCETCGSDKSQMHHDDYDQPTVVRWFCRPCHLDIHPTH